MLGEHGRGGLGRVSRAHDRELGRDVAIKELISRGHVSEVRFLREALITARLEHPGIVPVHEAGRWPDGTPFYAMKLVSGRSLRELIAERTTVEERTGLLHHVIAIADAIAYAHERNIIHRDLKPANVIVGDFGETIVIDWGLAKDLTTNEESTIGGGPFRIHRDDDLTATGSILGTPTYMAPEQERGEAVDQRADVFAIGAMLWELCSLHKVPPADARHRHHMLRRAGIDHDLAVIINKALAPEPARRYPDAGALAADLKAFKSGARIAARSYSLPAALAHWTRRHRTLALSAATVLALALVGIVFYVRSVANERDRADSALLDARVQAERAIIANTALLLERDPTQARVALASLRQPTRDVSLLRARVEAAAAADRTISFPARLDRMAVTPSRGWMVASTLDRSLLAVNLETGATRRLLGQTPEPAVFAATDAHVYAVVNPGHLALKRVSLETGTVEHIADLSALPADLQVSAHQVVWQYGDGSLHELSSGHLGREIANHVEQFALFEERLAFCDRGQVLTVRSPNSVQKLGPCAGSWSWGQSSTGLAIPRHDGRVVHYSNDGLDSNDGLAEYRFIEGRRPAHLVLADSGLMSAVDAKGEATVRVPGSDAFRPLHLGQRALATNAFGTYAAWDFPDGSVKLIDTASSREWSFKAHDHGIFCMYILPPGDRMVTCGRNEVRLWKLPPDAPTMATKLPAFSFNIARNDRGDLLFDGMMGAVHTLRRGDSDAVLIHKHASLSFSTAWCGQRACSGGWDGRLLCSSADGATTETLSFGTATRWLVADKDRCLVAVSNGDIYDTASSQVPIYRHDHEPYRISISGDGRLVASTDWNGTVKIWDTSLRQVVATIQRHAGLVVNAIWTDDNRLLTAGVDGYIHLFDRSFVVEHAWQIGSPLQYIGTSRDSVVAVTANGTVWRASLVTRSERRISLETSFTAFAISPRRSLVALGDLNGELFLIDDDLHVIAQRFDHSEHRRITCVTFEDDAHLLVCLPDGRVMRMALSSSE
jgi:WD40 repeat protein